MAIGSGLLRDSAGRGAGLEPSGTALGLAIGIIDAGACVSSASRSYWRFLRRRMLRLRVCGLPYPGGTCVVGRSLFLPRGGGLDDLTTDGDDEVSESESESDDVEDVSEESSEELSSEDESSLDVE